MSNSAQSLRKHKKKRNPKGLRKIHQRRRVEETNPETPELSPYARWHQDYAAMFCAMQGKFVRCIFAAQNQRESRALSYGHA
jgi:hypothetical protein